MTVAPGCLRIGEWQINPALDTLTRLDSTIKLEPRMTRLLLRLARTPGEVVSIDQLLNDVWTGVVVGPGSVYQSVSLLRSYLGDDGPEPTYIATVPRKGYRLVATVTPVTPATPAAATDAATNAPLRPATDVGHAVTQRAPGQSRRWRVAALAAAVLAAALLSWRYATVTRPGNPTGASLVILPFLDLTAGQQEQVFCDGLTEELSSLLAQLPNLQVVARTSAFAYRGKSTDIRTIGRELGAAYAVEGSVRHQGDIYRTTVQLIDARTGIHLWAGNYESRQGELMKLQTDIARSLVASLELRITQATSRRLFAGQTGSAQAYQLYVMAQAYRQRLTEADNAHAIDLYQQALTADRGYAPAMVGLAGAYFNEFYFTGKHLDAVATRMEPLVKEAAAIADAPTLHLLRGKLLFSQKRADEARNEFARAAEMNANASEAYMWLGFVDYEAARPRDALRHYDVALRLDPLNSYLHAQRCVTLISMDRIDEAELSCNRASSLRPESQWVREAQAWHAVAKGDFASAIAHMGFVLRSSPANVQPYVQQMFHLSTIDLHDAAMAVYRRALEAVPDNESARRVLTPDALVATLALDGPPGARALLDDYRKAALLPEEMLNVAYGYLLMKDFREARNWLDQAVRAGLDTGFAMDRPATMRTGFSWRLPIANIYLRTGSRPEADEQLARVQQGLKAMRDAGNEAYGLHEIEAQVAGLQGKTSEPLASLRRAIDLGWRAAWFAQNEDYFSALRENPGFTALIASVEQMNAEARRRVSADATK